MKLYLNFSEYAKFGSGAWEDFSDAILDSSFSRKSCFGAKGKSETQTVSIELSPVVGVSALGVRILTATNDIRAKLTEDDGKAYFIGTIRPLASLSVESIVSPVSIEILDDSYFLDYYMLQQASTLDSSTLKVVGSNRNNSLVHWLVSLCEEKKEDGSYGSVFADADIVVDTGVDTAIPADGITVEIGDKVNDILSAVCYEYGLQYRFDAAGKLHFAPAVPADAAVLTSSVTVTDSEMKNRLTIKRDDDARSGAVVTYYPVRKGLCTVAEHQVMDTRYADDKTWSRGYEWLNPDEGQWPKVQYQTETLSGIDLEKASRRILRYDLSTMKTVIKFADGSRTSSQGIGHFQQVSAENGKYQYRFWIAPTASKTLVKKFYLQCQCWYIDTEDEKRTKVSQGTNPAEHEAKYIHEAVHADNLLKILEMRNRTGNMQYSFQAFPLLNLTPGQIIKLDSQTVGISTYARVLSVTDHGDSLSDQLCSVICEGIQALSEIQVDATESIRSIMQRLGDEMLSLTPAQNPMKYDDAGTCSIIAAGEAIDKLGGTTIWYLNDIHLDGKDGDSQIFVPHTSMLVGDNEFIVEVSITGIDFGSKPLTAVCSVTLVKDGENGISPIDIQITSTNGDKFRRGTLDTILIATVFRGDDDITDSVPSDAFRWHRTSRDPTSDEAWNTSSKAIAKKELELTPEDAFGRAVFFCEVDISQI